MVVHLINPSDHAFGTSVITPRWLYVLAAATPDCYGTPRVIDETLDLFDLDTLAPGDVVGIGIHTANAHRGLELGRQARERGAWVIFGGIHSTLYPDEPIQYGGAHAVITGDGDVAWPLALADCVAGTLQSLYDGGRIDGPDFRAGRWELLPPGRYMWASVQTVRGCPKHCSFCSVWRTDGQHPRQRSVDAVVEEIVALRRLGFRFIALADDNFYPVSFKDLELARRQNNPARLAQLEAMRAERFELMARLEQLPSDTVFFTQITIEAGEDEEFLEAMNRARIRGGLVGVEAVTPEGLQSIFKDFNLVGDALVERLRTFKKHGVHVLGSFIFGLPTDRAETFDATVQLAEAAGLTFAQFVTLTPYPGTIDFERWEAAQGAEPAQVDGVPLTRYWLIASHRRPKLYTTHPTMSVEEIRLRTQAVWDRFYSISSIWRRADCVKSLKARLAFILVSKLYRQMYANTGIATDSARHQGARRWARWLARPLVGLFQGRPMPELAVPPAPVRPPVNVSSC